MKQNNLTKKTFALLLVAFVMAAILFLVPILSADRVAYADAPEEIHYFDDNTGTLTTESFAYSSKAIVQSKYLNSTFPAYYNTNNSLTNVCANVAGSNLIGYYDRYFADLIPSYVPGATAGTGYMYFPMTFNQQKKQDVINDLHVRMSTNNPDPGTTQAQFNTGLTSYVDSKNLDISYSSTMTNSAVDMQKVYNALNSGKPVALFLSGYNITQVSDANNVVTLNKNIFTGTHIMIIYGFNIINYYDANGSLLQSKTYLNVATGKSAYTGVYILNHNGTVNDAEAVHISEEI